MANSFESNFTRKLARIILKGFETYRTISKNVNTQLLKGRFDPTTGDNIDFKRPTDYRSVRTPNGDVSGETKGDIITGKATGTVQEYFTVFVDFDEADQAIKMDQQNELVEMPMMRRIVTDFELDFAKYVMKNTALLAGTVGTAATTWNHIANAGATMTAHGVPMDAPWTYAINPFVQTELASDQRSLGAGGAAGSMIKTAHQKATITEGFAGFDQVMTATSLGSYQTPATADRVGALAANPDVTYLAAKDTMTQSLSVSGFGANLAIKAGEQIQITGRNRLNLNTREIILDKDGAPIVWTATVTQDVTLDGVGAGVIVATGPAIYEATGAYNTADSAPISGDVVTLLAAASKIIQPNLFWHKDAFGIGSVPIKKLYSTDTIAQTNDGLQLRVSYGVGFLENLQKIRVDFRPAYATFNPFFAGQGFGSA